MSGSGMLRELNRTRMAVAGFQQSSVALTNEQVTRQRVERLEHARLAADPMLAAVTAVLGRGFWGRMRWLFLGR